MNDLEKPDLKHGVALSCIPEVGRRRRMQRKLKFQSTAVCAVVIMIATCRGLALDPSQPASTYLRKNFTIDDGLPANEVNAILQTQNGFLWLGTEAGLAQFDGQRFKPINMARSGTANPGAIPIDDPGRRSLGRNRCRFSAYTERCSGSLRSRACDHVSRGCGSE
jgi:hypothetical protein